MAEPYHKDSHISIYNSDCRAMAELPDESIQCVITSPPYWGLRKYSGEQDLIWGNNHCEHQWGEVIQKTHGGGNQGVPEEWQRPSRSQCNQPVITSMCTLCGAWKGAFGLEPTPEMYVQHTIEILREIRRVLRKDGVVFWNIGDSYGTSPPGTKGGAMRWQHGNKAESVHDTTEYRKTFGGVIKPKDLCLIPFRIAIAAQEDGWYVRSVIIWSKPNPMPESVTDRPTESHEYILLLTKSKNYYWDADAVREPHLPETIERYKYGYKESERDKLGHSHHGKGYQRNDGSPIELNAGRNLRTVWEFPTQPFPKLKIGGEELDHFAVFPEKLPELCIKAATPEVGCCSKCGKPWVRIVEKQLTNTEGWGQATKDHHKETQGSDAISRNAQGRAGDSLVETLGWQPSCNCNADKVPSIVLDPFMGTGTTLWVAKKLGRRAVGYDISEEYCKLSLERNRQLAFSI